jgi:membrane associated rhomboid family serine protease
VATVSLFIIGVISLLLFPPTTTAYIYSEPSVIWRFVSFFTHMVSHGGWAHLLGNFMFGFPYMFYLEYKLKSTKKFIRTFVFFGGAALLTQILFDMFALFKPLGLIGSSGAIFGVTGAVLMGYRGPKPIELTAKALLIFHIVTQAQAAYYNLTYPIGVASGAHLGGLLAGVWFSNRHLNPGPNHFQKLLRGLRRFLPKR